MGWRVPERNKSWEPENIAANDCLNTTKYGIEHFASILSRVNDGVEYDIDYFHNHLDKLFKDVLREDNNVDQKTKEDLDMIERIVKHAENEVLEGYNCCNEYKNALNHTLWVLLVGEEYYNAIKRLYDLYTDIGQYLIYNLPVFNSDAPRELTDLGDVAADIHLSNCQKFMERGELVEFKSWLRRTNAQFNDATVNASVNSF